MVNVKVTTKRCVSAVMAFLMAAMLVLGVSASPLTQVFAASATKKLKSGTLPSNWIKVVQQRMFL